MQGLITLAEQQPQNQGAGLISQLLMFALIIVVFYLLFIRPQQKRRQQELEMQKSLQPGMEVLTGAGIYGTIVEVHDDDVELEISPGTRVRMVKAAVARIVSS
ncbi:preprotein translocase subunit YajC [Thermobifida fusca]|uniref:Protein translocase subunit yajC n=2 Tax=Thermobifida fusca TaxID=2021 RepID=A0A9P2T9V5_THEFU|nr:MULTISPECIES: preprotein translocase subunit YajC [Thermobifida]AAZ56125.1 protein translocase subunit yajC [Thermobifida fusca YX]EOR70853.1 protein translocase subunit yajC [Thermobifida fusca TM51]MBO2530200.1 preprotein translocase subunit YajC [Thermobifida sp.]MDD6792789.1 preprotein translocase subunit YajC [Thermobifida fusca]PPS94354.1 preprotein translocase subunit YajC [Thermobifida fusca]